MFEFVFMVLITLNGQLIGVQAHQYHEMYQCESVQVPMAAQAASLAQSGSPLQAAVGQCHKRGSA